MCIIPGTLQECRNKLALQHHFDIGYDTAILAEYEQVLGRDKFAGRIHQLDIQRFFEILYQVGINIISSPSSFYLPDESDRKFYDVAKAANADIITGNTKDYPDEPFILTPTEFINILANPNQPTSDGG